MANYNQYGYQQLYQPYNTYPQYQQVYPQYQQNGLQPQQINQPLQQPQQIQQQTAQQPQIQSGGFISVRSIEEALNYQVAPGNSITFKDENAPYVYTKTRGFSQLEEPVFEKYRLVKEENGQVQEQVGQNQYKGNEEYALKTDLLDAISDFDDLKNAVKNLKKQINALQEQQQKLKKNVVISKTEKTEEEQGGEEE